MLEARGAMLVGQEAVTLSTAPVLSDGLLAPRPMSLRVFLARTPRGWRVMPGGYARVGRTQDATAIAMQRGGSVADVWVVSDKPVRNETLLPSPAAPYRRDAPERTAEPGGRQSLLDGALCGARRGPDPHAARVACAAGARAGGRIRRCWRTPRAYPGFFGADPAKGVPRDLHARIAAATASASQVRDRFSVDGWTALNELAASARIELSNIAPGYATARALGLLLRQITGFSGLVHDNMYRFAGWRFLSIGRSLERAATMASVLAWFADDGAPEGALDMAVEVGDSVLTHRRLFAVATSRSTVIDLLGCDADNPRSIHYQLAELKEHIGVLPGAREQGQMSELSRAILKLHADVAVTDAGIAGHRARCWRSATELTRVSDLLTTAYLR